MLSLPRLLTKQSQGLTPRPDTRSPLPSPARRVVPATSPDPRLSHIGRDPDGHSGGALRCPRPFRGLLGYQWSRGLWVTVFRTVLFPIARRRVASGSLPPIERVARCGHSSAAACARRRQDHGRSRPVAILATADRSSLIAAETFEQTRNRGRHGRPNAVVRSVARALAKCSSCGSPCFGGAEVNAIGGSHIMQSVDLIYRAKKISAEVDVDTCLNFIRGVF